LASAAGDCAASVLVQCGQQFGAASRTATSRLAGAPQ